MDDNTAFVLPLLAVEASISTAIQKSWQELIEILKNEDHILLKGPDHYLLAWDFREDIRWDAGTFSADELQAFLDKHKGNYVFGFLSYDCKNNLERNLVSENPDPVDFPDAFFRVPNHVLRFGNEELLYTGSWDESGLNRFLERKGQSSIAEMTRVDLKAMTSRDEYLGRVNEILQEIQQGNIYEMNYCVNFTGQADELDSVHTFFRLDELSAAPFSVLLNWGAFSVMSASPERYIRKSEDRLISQPIKGTARRDADPDEDVKIRQNLKMDSKERSENIMIVDLVRNDLSRVAKKNSVQVDELCEVYSFRTVHQLISTVSCELKAGTQFSDVLKATFPMGSMTGAPKISAMQISERVENFRRGLYSGTIGYIDPSGDYDFNVVIRSILYNRNTGVVSCGVGGAITMAAKPEKEYDECLLKLLALQKALC